MDRPLRQRLGMSSFARSPAPLPTSECHVLKTNGVMVTQGEDGWGNGQSLRAPTDCVQYFTGTAGQIYSYNFGQMLGGMYYTNCIRTEVEVSFHMCSSHAWVSGRLLWGDLQGGEWDDTRRLQLASGPLDHSSSSLPRLLCLHPKIEVISSIKSS